MLSADVETPEAIHDVWLLSNVTDITFKDYSSELLPFVYSLGIYCALHRVCFTCPDLRNGRNIGSNRCAIL